MMVTRHDWPPHPTRRHVPRLLPACQPTPSHPYSVSPSNTNTPTHPLTTRWCRHDGRADGPSHRGSGRRTPAAPPPAAAGLCTPPAGSRRTSRAAPWPAAATTAARRRFAMALMTTKRRRRGRARAPGCRSRPASSQRPPATTTTADAAAAAARAPVHCGLWDGGDSIVREGGGIAVQRNTRGTSERAAAGSLRLFSCLRALAVAGRCSTRRRRWGWMAGVGHDREREWVAAMHDLGSLLARTDAVASVSERIGASGRV